ncbi:MAG TPA: cytochrome P450 [Candidatus Acidoferrales bacterium]|nr:cytochrome P450 [Candidatus Acidoferrales bacterium]
MTIESTNQATGEFQQQSFSLLQVVQRLLDQSWFVQLLNPLMGGFNPFLQKYRADPYPFLHELRRRRPVYFSPVLREWFLSRHRDVVSILRDQRFSAERGRSNIFKRIQPLRGLRPDFTEAIMRNVLMLDPPDHTRLRRLVVKAFTPRLIEGLRPRIQAIVDELLQEMERRNDVDLVQALAYPLPVIVICEMLGVPSEDRAQLKKWSDDMAALLDPLQATGGMEYLERVYVDLAAYFRNIFAQRRAQPRDDLISSLVAVEDQGERLSEAELLSLCAVILGAGHETTTNLIGNAVVALLRNPTERRRLQDNPDCIGSAVEEFLRYDSPVQLTDRVALEDCEIGGKRIRKGVMVAVLLGAANRDPERFAEPDRLDIKRQDNDHVAFGHGVHFCLGASLARIETQVAIASLLRRFPDFSGDSSHLIHRRSMVLRGVVSLPVKLT